MGADVVPVDAEQGSVPPRGQVSPAQGAMVNGATVMAGAAAPAAGQSGRAAPGSSASAAPAAEVHEERLNRCSEEWLQLMRAALPAALEAAQAARAERANAEAALAAAAAAASAKEQSRREARAASKNVQSAQLSSDMFQAGSHLVGAPSADTANMTCDLGSTARSTKGGRGNATGSSSEAAPSAAAPSAVPGMGALLTGLDRLFSEQRTPHGSATLADMGKLKFRVQVPQSYPGVQFRRSKDLTNRYPKYAKNGTVVKGHVEDDGAWLRLNDKVFLPMRVGGVQILEAIQPEADGGQNKKSWWYACSHGNLEEEEEVLGNLEETG